LRSRPSNSTRTIYHCLILTTLIVPILTVLIIASARKPATPLPMLSTTIIHSQPRQPFTTAQRPHDLQPPQPQPQPAPPSSPPPPSTTTDTPQSDHWQTLTMRVTAYCPCEKCCGPYADGITASGHKIQPGDVFVAADRRFPFGTEMIIPGYNNDQPVKVLDRGGAIHGNRLDVFFHTHAEALQWGVRYLDVRIRSK